MKRGRSFDSCAGFGGRSFSVTQERIGIRMGMHQSSVSRWTRKKEKQGYVDITRREEVIMEDVSYEVYLTFRKNVGDYRLRYKGRNVLRVQSNVYEV